MNIHSIYARISPIFRRKRMRLFFQALAPTSTTRILDVGGYPWVWADVPLDSPITILNPHMPEEVGQFGKRFTFVVGDGCRLAYGEKSFDILYSNSVIEHLGTYERQVQFAREARRVGVKLWIQTPARSFFIEPHLMTPFIHFLPRRWQRRLLRYGTVWGWITRPSATQVDEFLNEVRLLSDDEIRRLFPDCEIYRERALGFTKSFVAIRR